MVRRESIHNLFAMLGKEIFWSTMSFKLWEKRLEEKGGSRQ